MPVELNDLLGDERWVPVEVNGHMFEVAYRPSATGLRFQAELQRAARLAQRDADFDEIEQVEKIAHIFCGLVCDWDLTRDGQPLPITLETVQELPGLVFNAILEAIIRDGQELQSEKKASSEISGAISSPAAKQARAQNGTRSSARRATWA